MIQNSLGLQYRFNVVPAGVVTNEHSSHDALDRIRSLRDRVEGWFHMQLDFRRFIPVINFPSGIYDLTGGIYFRGDSGRKTIHYCELPSAPIDVAVWKQVHVDKTLVDIGVSVYEHDLIAIMTFTPHPSIPRRNVIEIHLLQLSTGKPHPLAKNPVLFISETRASQPSMLIEIVGDHLVLVMSQHTPHFHFLDSLRVFEWKTGVLKLDVHRATRTYHDVIFLSPLILLLPNYNHNTLDIWQIPIGTEPAPTEPFLALALPGLTPGTLISNISCRAEPNPAPSGTPYSTAPFHDNPEDAIVVFNVQLHTLRNSSYTLFVHRRALLRACTTSTLQDEAGVTHYLPSLLEDGLIPGKRARAWADWGPDISRVLDASDIPLSWITTTAGQRAIVTYNEEGDEDEEIYQYSMLLDFTPAAKDRVSRDIHRGLAELEDHQLMVDPSEEFIFGLAEPVRSKLPYVSIAMPFNPAWGDRFNGMLMDEERILVLLRDRERHMMEVLHIGIPAQPSIDELD
ncbi:hypothetical protein H0H87_005107 [Tephrocybe sp. NHM501043]|nr:hypothetical protein H0H87_005107 [Tephrocybe sp. NHM501043]